MSSPYHRPHHHHHQAFDSHHTRFLVCVHRDVSKPQRMASVLTAPHGSSGYCDSGGGSDRCAPCFGTSGRPSLWSWLPHLHHSRDGGRDHVLRPTGTEDQHGDSEGGWPGSPRRSCRADGNMRGQGSWRRTVDQLADRRGLWFRFWSTHCAVRWMEQLLEVLRRLNASQDARAGHRQCPRSLSDSIQRALFVGLLISRVIRIDGGFSRMK